MSGNPNDFVTALLDGGGDAVEAFLAQVAQDDPHRLYYDAVLAYFEAENHRIGATQASERMAPALGHPPEDIPLYVVVLHHWVDLALRVNRPADAERGVQRLRDISVHLTRPELKALVAVAEYLLHTAQRQPQLGLDALNRALELPLPAGERTWYCVKQSRVYSAIFHQAFPLAASDLRDLAPYEGRYPGLAPLGLLWAYLHSASCEPERGLEHIETLHREDPGLRVAILRTRIKLRIELGRFAEADALLAEAERHQPPLLPSLMCEYLRALGDLHAGRFDETRARISRVLAIPNEYQMCTQGVFLDILLRADLASRRPESARRTLLLLDREENRPDLHMDWIRLYLLEGNEARATDHLRALLSHAPSERALLASLRSAYELSAYQLERLRLLAASAPEAPNDRKPVAVPHSNGSEAVFIGESAAAAAIREQLARLAPVETAVLITGETGTGKEVVARLLHRLGPHPDQPFIPVNCGGMSESLIESELFGHLKGAFTGATREHDGLFVAAAQGTILLDEIDAMPPRLQNSLMRVLEDYDVRPVGGTRFRHVECRVIAASKGPLEEAVRAGSFREDLYYRLARLHIHIPPLRERPEDILPLAKHFLRRLYGDFEVVLGKDLQKAMSEYGWPGNVRELKNELERIAVLAGDSAVLGAELFETGRRRKAGGAREEGRGEAQGAGILRPRPSGLAPLASPLAPPAPGLPLGPGHTQSRRRRLLELFSQYDRLTRKEIIHLLGCSPGTATADLRGLEQEGLLRRVQTSNHLRTSYFVRNA